MSSYVTKPTAGDTAWFTHDRFGMFIHFGLYSAGGVHEWFKTMQRIPDEQYDKYKTYFNPDLYDPKEWAKKAKAAGMKYAVMTTKHHEGFCMFDSQYTDYKCTNTPAGRDFVREFVDAFRAEGLKVGLYYSLIDWHHPDYQIDVFHPLRTHPNAQEMNKTRDMTRYREYLFNQVRELMTNYGKIDIFWFDFTYSTLESIDNEFNKICTQHYQPWMPWTTPETWDAPNLIKMMREINPNIIINDRTGLPQDIITPEQTAVDKWPTYKGTDELAVWEACHTFSGAWGYARDEMTWKSPEVLLRILIECVSGGGNLIMNVGPTARGLFDYRADAALKVYEDWMKYNSRSIYGCTKAEPEFTAPKGSVLTQSQDGKRLYIHLLDYPFPYLSVNIPTDRIDYAQFLHDASEIKFRPQKDGTTRILLPANKPNQLISVIELFLK